MVCFTLIVCLLGDTLRSVVAVNCPGLPTTTNDIQPALRTLLANNVGEVPASVTVTIVSGPLFTCQVQGTAVGTYQEVSLIVIYNSSEGHDDAVGQFEMFCVSFDNGMCSNDLTCTETNFVATEQNNYTCVSFSKPMI